MGSSYTAFSGLRIRLHNVPTLTLDLGKFNYIVSHYAFYKVNFSSNAPYFDACITDGTAAWMVTEKASLSPESDIDLIRAMHFQAANLLTARGLVVDSQCEEYRRFLWSGAGAAVFYHGLHQLIKYLFDDQSRGGVSNNLLPVAAFSGDEELIKILLRKSTDVNDYHTYFGSAFTIAVFKGYTTIAGLLLDAGADSDNRTDDGHTALHIAVVKGHESIVQLLLEKGASTSARFDLMTPFENITALHAAILYRRERVVQMLIEAGADINSRDEDKFTLLHRAAFHGNDAIVRILLEGGAEISPKDVGNMTPLHYAVSNGRKEVVSLLLSAGIYHEKDRRILALAEIRPGMEQLIRSHIEQRRVRTG
jgi:hypothetical protein